MSSENTRSAAEANFSEIGAGIARNVKYSTPFQLGSKPIVFHIVFHETKIKANRQLGIPLDPVAAALFIAMPDGPTATLL